jgi:hypothetical protein
VDRHHECSKVSYSSGTGDKAPTTTVTTTSPAAAPQPRPLPAGLSGDIAPWFEQAFTSITDAVCGISQELLEVRRAREDCPVRCGRRKGSSRECCALYCYWPVNMQSPLARLLKCNQIVVIKLAKRKKPVGVGWKLDESWKQSQIEVDGGNDVALYSDDAGYHSGNRFEDLLECR